MSKPMPALHRVFVKPDPLTEVEQREMDRFQSLQTSGFEIADATDKKRKQSAVHSGVIVAIGPQAFMAYAIGIIPYREDLAECGWSPDQIKAACAPPRFNVGDRVTFAKYGGYERQENGETYRVLNDEDITEYYVEDSQ